MDNDRKIQHRSDIKDLHITAIKAMRPTDEYGIGWFGESGAIIKKADNGYVLLEVSCGNIVCELYYRNDEIEQMVADAMMLI